MFWVSRRIHSCIYKIEDILSKWKIKSGGGGGSSRCVGVVVAEVLGVVIEVVRVI